MTVRVDFQNASMARCLPEPAKFRRWAAAALRRESAEIVIRVVDEAESAALNQTYRRKPGPTNVLSFPFEVPQGVPTSDFLGDLVICAGIVERESLEQNKTPDAHWAHLVVHGLLHLQGYDHVTDDQAALMEAEEIAVLRRLGFRNPYETEALSP